MHLPLYLVAERHILVHRETGWVVGLGEGVALRRLELFSVTHFVVLGIRNLHFDRIFVKICQISFLNLNMYLI